MIITTTDSSNESVTVGLLGCASEIMSHGNCSAFSGYPNDRLSPTNSFLRTHSDGRPGASPPHRGTIPVPLSSSAPDIVSRCVRGASVNDLCSFWLGKLSPAGIVAYAEGKCRQNVSSFGFFPPPKTEPEPTELTPAWRGDNGGRLISWSARWSARRLRPERSAPWWCRPHSLRAA